VKSAERTLDVLQFLSRRARPVPAAAIARQCAMPKSSTYHLLNVMRERGWVTYYPQERGWGLGIAAMRLASGYMGAPALEREGRAVLRRIASAHRVTAHLARLDGSEVVYVGKQQPAGGAVPLVTRAGLRLPTHLTAVGTAMLAGLDDGALDAIYGQRPLANLTRTGPRTLPELRRAVGATRERGFAYETGMVTPGISCLAVALRCGDGGEVAALGVTWPAAQPPRAAPDTLAAILADARAQLEAHLPAAPAHAA
jgi:DNA-binding IclR family transcriptional regulator